MAWFKRKPLPAVCPLPPMPTPDTSALDRVLEDMARGMREAHERMDRTLSRLKQIDPGEAK